MTNKQIERKQMTKEKAINFLYKDWLDYKNYYKQKKDFDMKESFIEYLEREIPEYIESEDQVYIETLNGPEIRDNGKNYK